MAADLKNAALATEWEKIRFPISKGMANNVQTTAPIHMLAR